MKKTLVQKIQIIARIQQALTGSAIVGLRFDQSEEVSNPWTFASVPDVVRGFENPVPHYSETGADPELLVEACLKKLYKLAVARSREVVREPLARPADVKIIEDFIREIEAEVVA